MTDNILELLKQKLDASTDSELARKLGVDRRTVSGWKARGSVPKRYLEILDGRSKNAFDTPPQVWGEYEKIAFRLALMRFGNYYHETLADSEYRDILSGSAKCAAAFWLLMSRAQQDLAAVMDEGAQNIGVAFSMLIHDDLKDTKKTAERDAASLNFGTFEAD